MIVVMNFAAMYNGVTKVFGAIYSVLLFFFCTF